MKRAGRRRVALVAAVVAVAMASSGCLAYDAAKRGRVIGFYASDRSLPNHPGFKSRMGEFQLFQPRMHEWSEVEPAPGQWNQSLIQDDENFWNATGRPKIWAGEILIPKDDEHTPAYLRGMNATTLRTTMKNHIQGLIQRHRRIYAWDVVSEAFHKDASGAMVLRDSVYKRKLGNDFIAEALRYAHAADPNTIVTYTELNADGLGEKSDAIYNYVKTHLVNDKHADRVPRDKLAIGFEMHISSCGPNDGFNNPSVDSIKKNLKRFSDLGVHVFIQGMDVAVRCINGSYAKQLEWQANKYHDIIAACLSVARCDTIVIEGIGDPDSWIVAWIGRGNEHPLLFDDNYNPKPAYRAVEAALQGR
jgi:endo-1,4-beta-xylanase